MRRPLTLFGFTLLGCGLWYNLLGKSGVLALLIVASLELVFVWLGKKHFSRAFCYGSLGAFGTAVMFSCVLVLLANGRVTAAVAPYTDTTLPLQVTVVEVGNTYDTADTYTVTAAELPSGVGRLQLQTNGEERYQIGQILEGTFTLQKPPIHNQTRLHSDRIFLVATFEQDQPPSVVGVEKSFSDYAFGVRERIQNGISSVLSGETAGVVSGICLGDTSHLSFATTDAFSQSGMSHMMAVSGLHITTLAGFLLGLISFFDGRKRIVTLLCLVPVWGFVFVVGAPYSAVRAGVMFSFLMLSRLLIRRGDSLNGLGGAVLLILLFDPTAVGDVGFLASVSACLGILLLSPLVYRGILGMVPAFLKKISWVKGLVGTVSITIGAFCAGLPCCLLCFYRWSPVSPLTNLLGVPLAGVVLGCGLAGSLLLYVPCLRLVGGWLLILGGYAARLLLWIAKRGSNIPFGSLPFGSVWCALGLGVVLVAGVLTVRFRHRLPFIVKRLVAVGLILCLISTSFPPVYPPDTCEVMIFRSAYEMVVAVTDGDHTVVIGCSLNGQLSKGLASRHIATIDGLILPTRNSFDKNARNLWERYNVQTIYTSPQNQQRGLFRFAHDDTVVGWSEIQVGTIGVEALSDYTAFRITVGGCVLLYREGEDEGIPAHIQVHHPRTKLHPAVTVNGQRIGQDGMIFIGIRKGKIKVYQPRFLFS